MKRMGNVERNTYVKKQLTRTLLKLLNKKTIDGISVSELTTKAGIGRVSFYRNYNSIQEILEQESDRLMAESEKLPKVEGEPSYFSFFDFLIENKSFYLTLHRAGLSNIIKESIVKTAQITPEDPNLQAYLKAFWAYGLYGWICEWMDRGMQESSEEIFSLFEAAMKK